MFHYTKQRYDKAEEYFLKSLSLLPNDPNLLFSHFKFLESRNQQKQAQEVFSQIEKNHPSYILYIEKYKNLEEKIRNKE
jgi:tetratricopeptide (TPR) repeat protein